MCVTKGVREAPFVKGTSEMEDFVDLLDGITFCTEKKATAHVLPGALCSIISHRER
jgi:hypothetical protein